MMRLRIANVVGACLALVGCGWHLQGSLRLPPGIDTTHIETEDAYTDFYRELRRVLLAAGAKVPAQPVTAGAVVRVRKEEFGQRVAVLSPSSTADGFRVTAEEFQVFYTVDYSVEVGGVEVLPPQHLELATNYSYDATAALAKQREQHIIREALARELAVQVLRRLASIKTTNLN